MLTKVSKTHETFFAGTVFEVTGYFNSRYANLQQYFNLKEANQKLAEENVNKRMPASVPDLKVKKEEKPKTEPAEKKSAPKLSYKDQYELDRLPRKIKEYETELIALNTIMADPDLYTRDPGLFYDTAKKHAQMKEALELAETRWLELEDMLTKMKSGA